MRLRSNLDIFLYLNRTTLDLVLELVEGGDLLEHILKKGGLSKCHGDKLSL